MNGTTIVAVVSVISAALVTPLVAGFLTERNSRRSMARRDFLDLRKAIDDAGAEQRRLWWNFRRIDNEWAGGKSASENEGRQAFADYLNAREAVSVCQTKLAIRLGQQHAVTQACSDMNTFADELVRYLEGYRNNDPYDSTRYEEIHQEHDRLRKQFLSAAESAYNGDSPRA